MNSIKKDKTNPFVYTFILYRDKNDIKELLEGHPKVFFALLNKNYVEDKLFSNKDKAIEAAKKSFTQRNFLHDDDKFDYWIITLKGNAEELIRQWPESDKEFTFFYDKLLEAENNLSEVLTIESIAKLAR